MHEAATGQPEAATGQREAATGQRVVRNDWSRIVVPDLDGWRPTLTLASLRRQTYPPELLEVVVVDDGSEPALTLPPIRPERTTLVRVDEGWGRANALRTGVGHSNGEILHWLDADMVVFPEHVAAQARWHHAVPYAVTLGYKRFVDGPWPSPADVLDTPAENLFAGPGEPHTYVERYIAQTDQLRTADHLAFRIHVGATAALRRELYDAAGGLDPALRLGEDTELGYRLAQAGAVFVPEPKARSWHLGRTHVMRHRDDVDRWNRAHLADRVPYPRHWRDVGGTAWSVPLVEAVVPVGDEPLEGVRAAVDSLLRGTEPDVRVSLVGPWDKLDDARVRVLSDPRLELRLIAATYRGEPRVRLVEEPPASAFPSPFLLELPAAYALAPDSLARMVDLADRHQVGVVRASGPPVLLWRTAALGRARWVRSAGESLLDAVTSVYGRRDVAASAVGIADPSVGGAAPGRRRFAGRATSTVEVAGFRSLARATALVGRLTARRAMATLRRVARLSR